MNPWVFISVSYNTHTHNHTKLLKEKKVLPVIYVIKEYDGLLSQRNRACNPNHTNLGVGAIDHNETSE